MKSGPDSADLHFSDSCCKINVFIHFCWLSNDSHECYLLQVISKDWAWQCFYLILFVLLELYIIYIYIIVLNSLVVRVPAVPVPFCSTGPWCDRFWQDSADSLTRPEMQNWSEG